MYVSNAFISAFTSFIISCELCANIFSVYLFNYDYDESSACLYASILLTVLGTSASMLDRVKLLSMFTFFV